MNVRLVCYETAGEWIISKFASRLNDALRGLGVNSEIGNSPDPRAEVNHHLLYLGYDGCRTSMNTLMVTHIDTVYKMRTLRHLLTHAEMGICMSRHTMSKLAAAGFPQHKLCYVHPAHDGMIRPRPLLIGITSRVYQDGRKREHFLGKLCRLLDPADVRFWIMGQGWDAEVAKVRELGFAVDYHADFDGRLYNLSIPALDYFLYFGTDEGSMGVLDALAAGVKTIVTPVGYQADLSEKLTFTIRNFSDLAATFDSIIRERKVSMEAVAGLTWGNYARKHLLIWEYVLSGRDKAFLERNRSPFPDGLAALDNKKSFLPEHWLGKAFFFRSLVGNSLKLRLRKWQEKGSRKCR